MTGLDFAGHMGFLFIIGGLWRLGKNDPKGFLLHALGACIWCGIGYCLNLSSVIFWNVVFVLLSSLGYYRLKDKIRGGVG